MTPPSSHRFSERSFRFYENAISQAVERGPAFPTTFRPALFQRSPETFRARMRDACRALLCNPEWNNALARKLRNVFDCLVFSITKEGHVVVGSKQALKSGPIIGQDLEQDEPLDFTGLAFSTAELVIIAMLAEARVLTRPIKVQTTMEFDPNSLTKRFDVDLEPLPGSIYIIR